MNTMRDIAYKNLIAGL